MQQMFPIGNSVLSLVKELSCCHCLGFAALSLTAPFLRLVHHRGAQDDSRILGTRGGFSLRRPFPRLLLLPFKEQ